jgi:hypothetical protein
MQCAVAIGAQSCIRTLLSEVKHEEARGDALHLLSERSNDSSVLNVLGGSEKDVEEPDLKCSNAEQ